MKRGWSIVAGFGFAPTAIESRERGQQPAARSPLGLGMRIGQ
jgi:hypothetical protein